MLPTILIIGATGNTGKAVTQTLPALVGNKYRILGLTRSLESAASIELSGKPGIEMEEKDWTAIDAAWLQERHVVRAFIASHNLAHQFFDESDINVALLKANVEYVVRVSTDAAFLGPSSTVYYGRAHWAIENQLSQPEFDSLHWTSLRPNLFTASSIMPAVEWLNIYRQTGSQTTLRLSIASNQPVGIIAPEDVGQVAAHLLSLDDVTVHNKKRYNLSGPEDVTGLDIVTAVEERAGTRVENVEFGDTSFIIGLESAGYTANTIASILSALDILKSGASSASNLPTSEELLHVAPRRTFRQVLDGLI